MEQDPNQPQNQENGLSLIFHFFDALTCLLQVLAELISLL